MKLYRVSFNLSQPLLRTFIPLIPESTGFGEDRNIKRVCLSSSIEGCLQAIPREGKDIKEGTTIIVYEVEIDDDDEKLVYPSEVREYVPDALENEEYWYLGDLTMEGRKAVIGKISCGYEFAFTAMDEDDFICKILDVLSKSGYKYLEDATNILMQNDILLGERYYEMSDILYSNREYDLQDEIADEIVTLPWSQTLKIAELVLT